MPNFPGLLLLAAAATFSAAVGAQDYPSKLIKIVVPTPPGGGLDRMARLVSDKLRDRWAQPVIIDNRAGAGGNVGAEAVWKADPDGYTVLITAPGPLVVNKSLYTRLGFDPDTFAPVSLVVTSPNVLLVSPNVSAASVQQLIAFAKANPDKLNYASQGSGTTAHLAAELFKSMAGVKIVHVPYKDNPAAVLALLTGQVDMIFTDLGNALLQIKGGKVRAIAVGSERRSSFLPDLPAMSEILPGLVSTFWAGIVAPPGTPLPIVTKFSTGVAEALKQPDIAKTLQTMSFEPVGSTPADLASFMKQESERWGTVIRTTGIKAD